MGEVMVVGGSHENSDRKCNLKEFEPQPEYNTEDDFIVIDFYTPCLVRSTKYDRAVGYFRANIYRELGEDLLIFAKRGGKVALYVLQTFQNLMKKLQEKDMN